MPSSSRDSRTVARHKMIEMFHAQSLCAKSETAEKAFVNSSNSGRGCSTMQLFEKF